MNRPTQFNLLGSRKAHAAALYNILHSPFGLTLQGLSFLSLIGGIGLYLWHYQDGSTDIDIIFIGIGLILLSFVLFLRNSRYDKNIDSPNLAEWLSVECLRILIDVRSKSALLKGLLADQEGLFVITRARIAPQQWLGAVGTQELSAQDKQRLALRAWDWMKFLHDPQIRTGHLFIAFIEEETALNELVNQSGLTMEDMKQLVFWYSRLEQMRRQHSDPHLKFAHIEPFAADWNFGYATVLFQFARDLSKEIRANFEYYHTYGRQVEITRLQEALSAAKNANALLIGPPGIGKSSIVLGLAHSIIGHQSYPQLEGKRIFSISSESIFNGANSLGEAKQRLTKLLNSLHEYGNGILYIEDIHNFFDISKTTVGAGDFSEILTPYLSSDLQIIGATTYQSFHATLGKNANLTNLFHRLDIDELSDESTLQVLEDTSLQLQYRYKVLITLAALRQTNILAKRYIHDKPMPEKAIDLLESTAVRLQSEKKSIMESSDVEVTVSTTAKVPIGGVGSEEHEKLLTLEDNLHKLIIGQDRAIVAVADALRRSRAGLSSGKRPIGSFLFLGPTGVGKTATAKALAATYFGDVSAMVRLDMSEYQEISSISRLIGENGTGGYLTDAIADNPYSLILLEELEKANKDLLNIFLQVFEDGRLTDGLGRTIDFTNTIIIATSNAGSEKITELLRTGKTTNLQAELTKFVVDRNLFRPEFINRFDAVIVFEPLSALEVKEVVQLLLQEVQATLADRHVKLNFTEAVINKIASSGYDAKFGARTLRRYIQDHVESAIAAKLLSNRTEGSTEIVFDLNDLK